MALGHPILAPKALVNGMKLVLGWNAPRKAHSTQNKVYNYDFAIIKIKHGCGFQEYSRVVDAVCPNHIME